MKLIYRDLFIAISCSMILTACGPQNNPNADENVAGDVFLYYFGSSEINANLNDQNIAFRPGIHLLRPKADSGNILNFTLSSEHQSCFTYNMELENRDFFESIVIDCEGLKTSNSEYFGENSLIKNYKTTNLGQGNFLFTYDQGGLNEDNIGYLAASETSITSVKNYNYIETDYLSWRPTNPILMHSSYNSDNDLQFIWHGASGAYEHVFATTLSSSGGVLKEESVIPQMGEILTGAGVETSTTEVQLNMMSSIGSQYPPFPSAKYSESTGWSPVFDSCKSSELQRSCAWPMLFAIDNSSVAIFLAQHNVTLKKSIVFQKIDFSTGAIDEVAYANENSEELNILSSLKLSGDEVIVLLTESVDGLEQDLSITYSNGVIENKIDRPRIGYGYPTDLYSATVSDGVIHLLGHDDGLLKYTRFENKVWTQPVIIAKNWNLYDRPKMIQHSGGLLRIVWHTGFNWENKEAPTIKSGVVVDNQILNIQLIDSFSVGNLINEIYIDYVNRHLLVAGLLLDSSLYVPEGTLNPLTAKLYSIF